MVFISPIFPKRKHMNTSNQVTFNLNPELCSVYYGTFTSKAEVAFPNFSSSNYYYKQPLN